MTVADVARTKDRRAQDVGGPRCDTKYHAIEASERNPAESETYGCPTRSRVPAYRTPRNRRTASQASRCQSRSRPEEVAPLRASPHLKCSTRGRNCQDPKMGQPTEIDIGQRRERRLRSETMARGNLTGLRQPEA